MTTNGNHTSKHERAYALIRGRILDGTYTPGRRLVIDALAEELGISPVPVREAIRRLEAEGRVVYRHNVGARVAPTDERRHLRLGVDVGSTSTDAVVMDGAAVIAAVKQPTTPEVTEGIAAAVDAVIREARLSPHQIAAVLVGTTQFAQAFADRRLVPAACIRLGLPAGDGLPPTADWPADVRASVACRVYQAHGGHGVDGRVLSPVQPEELRAIAADARRHDVESVAISAIFSPVSADAERQAAAVLQAAAPELAVTLSHQIGRLGLLERENAAIINACLRGRSRGVVAELRAALRRRGIGAPLFLTQNDGTLMTAEFAERFPVLTFSSGSANSMRGACFLTGLHEGIVVDMGGSAADVGTLVHGFPREDEAEVRIGGIRTNFRMPHVRTIALGGGSIVSGPPWQAGPRSVGSQLVRHGLVFGGHTLTVTDVAVAASIATLGDPARVAHLCAEAPDIVETISGPLRRAVERVTAVVGRAPVLLVGGSAWLARAALPGWPTVQPDHHAVANAVGAATAPVSGAVDRVISLEGRSRQEALAQAVAEAVGQAVASGADPARVQVAWAEDIPLAYLPGNLTRVRVKAIGALAVEALHGR